MTIELGLGLTSKSTVLVLDKFVKEQEETDKKADNAKTERASSPRVGQIGRKSVFRLIYVLSYLCFTYGNKNCIVVAPLTSTTLYKICVINDITKRGKHLRRYVFKNNKGMSSRKESAKLPK